MQTVLPSEFKRGMVVLLEGVPHVIDEFHVTGTAQSRHRLHVRLRSLMGGRVGERVFTDGERYPVAALQHRPVRFSYRQGSDHVFADDETFEELTLTAGQLGDRTALLKEGQEARALLLDGQLVDIVLPPAVSLRITETAPPVRGGSDSRWKPARLETGLEVMVPLFLAAGETVRVGTEDRKYAGKDTGAQGEQH